MLIAPKRLFDVVDMKVKLYDDIQDDVKDKGYVIVSHAGFLDIHSNCSVNPVPDCITSDIMDHNLYWSGILYS